MQKTPFLSLLFILPILCFGQISSSDSFTSSFVRISEKNPNYFELSNGKTYIPIGLNLCWAKDFTTMETYFKKLSDNKGNYARIWLNYPNHEVELEYGKVDEERLGTVEKMLSLAVKYNVKVKLCIESFRQINTNKGFFVKSQYHKNNGGPFSNMTDFINSQAGRDAYLNRLRIFKNRFGNHSAVFGWELWNEMDAVDITDGLRDWNQYMLPQVHAIFPKNLVLQSMGSFDNEKTRSDYRFINQLKSNDVAQIHRYLDMGASLDICKGPMDELAADAIDELRSYQVSKPMLLAEVGGVKPKHTGPIEVYANDKAGMLMHDLLFAPFFTGAAGPGHAWHWDNYVDRNNLWYHFNRFAKAINGVDPVTEKFIPVKISHPDLRIYALIGTKTILLWCRDNQNDWQNELVKGVPPRMLSALSMDVSSIISKQGIKSISSYDPWADKWMKVNKQTTVQLPDFKRSLIVKLKRNNMEPFNLTSPLTY